MCDKKQKRNNVTADRKSRNLVRQRVMKKEAKHVKDYIRGDSEQ